MSRARTTPPGDTLHGGHGKRQVQDPRRRAGQHRLRPGSDTALLDFKDVIVDATAQNPNGSCEVVNRRAPKPHEDKPENATPPEGH
jgi:hypothetical protein